MPLNSKTSCRLFGLLMLALSWLCVPSADASPIVLTRLEPCSLAGHLEILSDPGGTLALGDILTGKNAARFREIPGFVNLGYTSEASWTRFSLSRTHSFPRELFLRLGPSMLDNVTVYVQAGSDPSTAASYREYVLGDHHPVAGRPVRHSSFVVPIILPEETAL